MIKFPKSYDDEFNSILSKGRKIYNLYVDSKINDDKIKSFGICKRDFEYFYFNCEKFSNKNNKDKYICTKIIAKFLEDTGNSNMLTYMEDSKIKKGLAKYVQKTLIFHQDKSH